MNAEPDLAAVGAVLGDRSRATMLNALLSGDALALSELARRANVGLPTASSHLNRLVQAKLVTVEIVGRQRTVRLAGRNVARALEALQVIAPVSERPESAVAVLRSARTCYDHLAGALGVAVSDALVAKGWLRRWRGGFELTDSTQAGFKTLGVDVAALSRGRRAFLRGCLDWSERRPHVAGTVGAALAERFLDARWVTRVRESRALRVTATGRTALHQRLGISLPE